MSEPKHSLYAHAEAGGFGVYAEGCPACEAVWTEDDAVKGLPFRKARRLEIVELPPMDGDES